jgi:hypothetical protein
MPVNPYQSPSAPAESPTSKPFDTRAIVRYRRIIMLCVAVLVPYYLVMLVMLNPPYSESGPAARAAFAIHVTLVGPAMIALLVATFATGLLGTKLHGPIAGILLGLASFYPIIGFLPMAWILFRSRRGLVSATDTPQDA